MAEAPLFNVKFVIENRNSPVPPGMMEFTTYEEGKEIVDISSSTSGEENVNLEGASGENSEEEIPNMYLSRGIYIHPLTLTGNYENIIELIDVNPNKEIENSPLQDHEEESDVSNFQVANNQEYDFAYGSTINPMMNNNVVFPFLNTTTSYENLQINNELQCLQLFCETPSTTSELVPEFIELNNLIPKETKRTVPPFLKRNRKSKSDLIENKPEPKEDVTEYRQVQDDDVIFIQEYKVTPHVKLETPQEVKEILSNTSSVEIAASSSSLTSQPQAPIIRRRRRRKTFGEKRKNPVRKAQINKASLDLAEKLAIPSSVFNARVKGRKPKQIVVESKNLRQSCRTTGAIFVPPRPLTNNDFKEWPVDGMHERPHYDEATSTIRKLDLPVAKKSKSLDVLPVLAELSSSEINIRNAGRINRKRITKENQQPDEFAKTALNRIQMLHDYTQELKEFNVIVGNKEKTSSAEGSTNQILERKPTLYERNLKFRLLQNEIKETKKGKEIKKIAKGYKEENIKSAAGMLKDACILYSVASGVDHRHFINLITGHNTPGFDLKINSVL